jgi:hypothetical protein
MNMKKLRLLLAMLMALTGFASAQAQEAYAVVTGEGQVTIADVKQLVIMVLE